MDSINAFSECEATTTKVLVVDDEPDLVSLLQEWLEEDGHEVHSATDGAEALRLFFKHKPALSITDLRMPEKNGFQLISRIREMSDVGVLVLTAQGSEENMVRGLDLGADDYLVKPVSKQVFLARVRSLLRRAPAQDEAPSEYSDASVHLNFRTHDVEIRGQYRHLRPIEFRLLALLVQNRDRVMGHQEILDRVWGELAGSLDSLKWYISSLREKVEEAPRSPRLTLTVPRVGYRYLPPDLHPRTEQPED